MKWFLMLAVALSCVFTNQSFAGQKRQTGFVKIRADRALYVDYLPAENDEPILVLLNGLTYDLTNFDKMIPYLVGHGYGILRYDPWGMGQTLLTNGYPTKDIPIQNQARDLKDLLKAMKITKKVSLMGLSYGGGIALKFSSMYPELVDQMILMSSFVSPRNSAPSNQDEIIKSQINWVRTFQPWNTSTDDELYNYFLRQLIYQTYPTAEPSVLTNPYKLEATYRLIQGIRTFFTDDLNDLLPAKSVHFMIADQDQYVPRQMFEDFWSRLPKSKKLSRININGTEHKMPDAIPVYASSWINQIMSGDTNLRKGLTYQGDVQKGKAVSGEIEYKLPTDYRRYK